MEWLNEPPGWDASERQIRVTTGESTDFWQKTHYGHSADNGHFYFRSVSGDFTAQVAFRAEYKNEFDQAGLMVRLDERNWIKAGVEYFDDREHLSAVVTREMSDWSVHRSQTRHAEVWLRVIRLGDSLRIEYAFDGVEFNLMRLAYFPVTDPVQMGVMCCSPKGGGLEVTFVDFRIE